MTQIEQDKSGDSATVSFGFEEVAPDEKVARVKGVFRSVAGKYDLMNDLMSAGVHRLWKHDAMNRINPQPGERHLDVAGGTGELARAFLRLADAAGKRRGDPRQATAIVCDINDAMLTAGKVRGDNAPWQGRLDWVCADGQSGGRLGVLEFSQMTAPLLQKAYDTYSFNVIPPLGGLIAGDRASYQYLIESIRKFPDQAAFKAEVESAGFSRVSVTNFSGGIAALHFGWAV